MDIVLVEEANLSRHSSESIPPRDHQDLFGETAESSAESTSSTQTSAKKLATGVRSDSAISPIHPVIEKRDLGLLKFEKNSGKVIIPDNLRLQIVTLGSGYFKNKEGPFFPKHGRCMNQSWFKRKLGDGSGKEVERSWLVYSPSKASAYCFCCLIFKRSEDNVSSLTLESGFSQWKHPERMSSHENAPRHRESFFDWKEMDKNSRLNRVIDAELQASYLN